MIGLLISRVDARAVADDDHLLDQLPTHRPDDRVAAVLAAWQHTARASLRERPPVALRRAQARPYATAGLLRWVAGAWAVLVAIMFLLVVML